MTTKAKPKTKSKTKLKSKIAVCQAWLESESGWGIRPDGFSLHASKEDLKFYVDSYWAGMPKTVPDEYSRPDGEPYLIEVSEKLFRTLKKKKGSRFYSKAPSPNSKINEAAL